MPTAWLAQSTADSGSCSLSMSFEDASFAASPEVGVQNPSQNCENRCADDSYGQSDQRQHPVAEPRPQQDAAKCGRRRCPKEQDGPDRACLGGVPGRLPAGLDVTS